MVEPIKDPSPLTPSKSSGDKGLLKNCACCGMSLGLGLGIIHSKKFSCGSCQRTVCKSCAANIKRNLQTKKDEHWCDDCWNQDMQVLVEETKEATKASVLRSQQKVDMEEREKNDARVRREGLEAEITRIKSELVRRLSSFGNITTKLHAQLTELKTKYSEQQTFRASLIQDLHTLNKQKTQVSEELKTMTQDLHNSQQSAHDIKETLGSYQDQASDLHRLIDRKRTGSLTSAKPELWEIKNELKQVKDIELSLSKEVGVFNEGLTITYKLISKADDKINDVDSGGSKKLEVVINELKLEEFRLKEENRRLQEIVQKQKGDAKKYHNSLETLK